MGPMLRRLWIWLLILTVQAMHAATPNAETRRCEVLSRMYQEYLDTATLVTALFRGDSQGLLAILSAAASDSGPCLVDVVLPCSALQKQAEIARALVDKATDNLLSAGAAHASGELVTSAFRVVEGDEDDDGKCSGGARSEWEHRSEGSHCGWTGYHIIMEDGIEYPEDYLTVARQAVDGMSRRAVIGYSGFVWNVEFIKIGVPYADATYAVPLSGLEGSVELDVWVDVLRLGTVAFHSDLSVHAHTHLDLASKQAADAQAPKANAPQMAAGPWALDQRALIRFARGSRGLEDIEFAVEAHYRHVPRLLCTRPADWLRNRIPPALAGAPWMIDRSAFPAISPLADASGSRCQAEDEAANEAYGRAALRLALQFAPWALVALPDAEDTYRLLQRGRDLGNGRRHVEFETVPFTQVDEQHEGPEEAAVDDDIQQEEDLEKVEGDLVGDVKEAGADKLLVVSSKLTLVIPVFWRRRVGFLRGTLRRLVQMSIVDRVLVVWNNPMWPVPPCLLCAAEDVGGEGSGGKGDEVPPPGGEDRVALWEAGGKVVVMMPPPGNATQYASSSLNNRFWPYSPIRTEAVLSMDDDFRPTHRQLRQLFNTWRAYPQRLVGPMWLVTRSIACKNSACDELVYVTGGWPGYYNLILTGFALFHRGWLAVYSRGQQWGYGAGVSDGRRLVDGKFSCEDILLNYLVAAESAGPPVAIDIGDILEQEDSGGLSTLGSHWATRSRCATELAGIFRRARGKAVVLTPGDKSSAFRMGTGGFNDSSFALDEAAHEKADAARERRRLLKLLRAAWKSSQMSSSPAARESRCREDVEQCLRSDGAGSPGVDANIRAGQAEETISGGLSNAAVSEGVTRLAREADFEQEDLDVGRSLDGLGDGDVADVATGDSTAHLHKTLIVVTVVYRNVVMLRKQVETLQRFLIDDYHMIAAIDSPHQQDRDRIISVECDALEIECHQTPFSDSDGTFDEDIVNRPSWSHMRALNWLLHKVVFADFKDALLLILDPDVFLMQPFSIRDFMCEKGQRCGLAPPRDLLLSRVRPCHVSGVPQNEKIHAYPHVSVLMLDLHALPDLETMSLNPADFAEGYADSGGELLVYLWRHSLRSRSSIVAATAQRASACSSSVVEFPAARNCWWSDGLARARAADANKQGVAADRLMDAGDVKQEEIVVCWLEHSYFGLGQNPVVGGPGQDAKAAVVSSATQEDDIGWCMVEGGVCGSDGKFGGSESCHQGLPDAIGGRVWMHARRSSDWDLLMDLLRMDDPSDQHEPSFVAKRDSKWRRLQCIVGCIHHRIATHPTPHPRPRAAASTNSQSPAKPAVDISSANHAFSRNGATAYGDPDWFHPRSLVVNDGRLSQEDDAVGAPGEWELDSQAAVIVFKSGLEAVSVHTLELWGSWFPCRVNVSYAADAHDKASGPKNPQSRLFVSEAVWLPLRMSSRHGDTEVDGQVEVGGAVRDRVLLPLASPVSARALRLLPLETLGGRLETPKKCQFKLEEIVVN